MYIYVGIFIPKNDEDDWGDGLYGWSSSEYIANLFLEHTHMNLEQYEPNIITAYGDSLRDCEEYVRHNENQILHLNHSTKLYLATPLCSKGIAIIGTNLLWQSAYYTIKTNPEILQYKKSVNLEVEMYNNLYTAMDMSLIHNEMIRDILKRLYLTMYKSYSGENFTRREGSFDVYTFLLRKGFLSGITQMNN